MFPTCRPPDVLFVRMVGLSVCLVDFFLERKSFKNNKKTEVRCCLIFFFQCGKPTDLFLGDKVEGPKERSGTAEGDGGLWGDVVELKRNWGGLS